MYTIQALRFLTDFWLSHTMVKNYNKALNLKFNVAMTFMYTYISSVFSYRANWWNENFKLF